MYYDFEDKSLLSKLDRKFGKYALKNLSLIIVIVMGLVWVADYLLIRMEYPTLSSFIAFDKNLVLQGEVWRVITFVFVPESSGLTFLIFGLYFFWFTGTLIEREWGAFKFNIFYLVGYLGSLGFGFLTGYATSYYLNLTLFLAFAILNPNLQVMLFFFIPVKVKWIALVDFIFIMLELLVVHWVVKIAIIVALLNVILFFWRGVFYSVKSYFRRKRFMRELNSGYEEAERRERKRQKAKVKDVPKDEDYTDDDLFN